MIIVNGDSFVQEAHLDLDTWINKTIFSSMSEILDDFPKTKDWHIGAEGSKHWANIIKRHLD